ncbi:MAG: glycosyltransferase family 2 protein [Smithellaceae bacterium]|jgi:glycosyltransferase involved in cell wall biosynthesis
MNMPKISILIPTYNRAAFLRNALDSIVAQNARDIECVISDNASSDDTAEIVKSFQKNHAYIKYFRNEANLGFDSNILASLSRATGEYVWLFGDDDYMLPGAIGVVRETIARNYNLALVYVNYSISSRDFKKIIKRRAVPLYKNKLCKTSDDCLKTILCDLTFMSSLVFQRALYPAVRNCENFIGSGFIHFYIVLSILKRNRSYIIAEPYVKNRSGNSGDYPFFKYFVVGLCRILDAAKRLDYKSESITKTKKAILRLLIFRKILVFRSVDPKSLKGTLQLLIENFSSEPFFWFFVLPVYFVPSVFVRFLYSLYMTSFRGLGDNSLYEMAKSHHNDPNAQ